MVCCRRRFFFFVFACFSRFFLVCLVLVTVGGWAASLPAALNLRFSTHALLFLMILFLVLQMQRAPPKRGLFCRYFEGNSPAAIRNICLLYQVGNYQNTLSTVEFDDSGFWFICFLSLYVTSSINNINI